MTRFQSGLLGAATYFGVSFLAEFLRLAYREYFPCEPEFVVVSGGTHVPEMWSLYTSAAVMVLGVGAVGFLVAHWLTNCWIRRASVRDVMLASAVVAVAPILFMAVDGLDRASYVLGIPVGPPSLVVVLVLGIVSGLIAVGVTSRLSAGRNARVGDAG